MKSSIKSCNGEAESDVIGEALETLLLVTDCIEQSI